MITQIISNKYFRKLNNQKMENLRTQNIGKFVADDYRTAAVFQNYGIDFCCRGGKTINEVCESKNISADELLTKLNDVSNQFSGQYSDLYKWF